MRISRILLSLGCSAEISYVFFPLIMQCLPLLKRTMQKLVTLPRYYIMKTFFSRFSTLGGFESIVVVFVMLFRAYTSFSQLFNFISIFVLFE